MSGGFFVASYVLLWLVVVAILVLLLSLYRELGHLYLRTRGATTRDGPRVGTSLDQVRVHDGSIDVSSGNHLLLFGLNGCGICESLIEELGTFERQEIDHLGLHLLVQTDGGALPYWAAASGLEAAGTDSDLASRLRVRVSPFAIHVRDGVVRAKGVVNHAIDLFRIENLEHPRSEEG